MVPSSPARVATGLRTGISAVIGATHMQFLMPQPVARKILPLPVTYGLGRQEDRSFDQKVDQAGYLHLSTLEAYVWHMGNVLDEKTLREVQSLGLPERLAMPLREKALARKSRWMRFLRRLARLRLLRAAIYRLYNLLFELYAQ